MQNIYKKQNKNKLQARIVQVQGGKGGGKKHDWLHQVRIEKEEEEEHSRKMLDTQHAMRTNVITKAGTENIMADVAVPRRRDKLIARSVNSN